MDPDANLKEQRELREELGALVAAYNNAVAEQLMEGAAELADSIADKTGRLLELMEGLDNWLSGGAFLPRAWQYGRR